MLITNTNMKIRSIFFLLIILLSSVGCVPSQLETGLPNQNPTPFTMQPDLEVIQDLALAVNDFGFSLLWNLREEEGNLILAPFSLYQSLTMVYAGARNETADQMHQVLGFDLNQTRLHTTMRNLNTHVSIFIQGKKQTGRNESVNIWDS